MDNIKNILSDVIGTLAHRQPQDELKTERIWTNITTPLERQHTQISGIKDKTIVIIVDSPAWLYQMRTKKWKLLQRIKDELPGINQVQFKIGKLQ